jgi:hypothetical protein
MFFLLLWCLWPMTYVRFFLIPLKLLWKHSFLLFVGYARTRLPLKGVRKARSGRSQLSIVLDLLKEANRPLHITEIVEQAHKRFGQKLDRESLVSALSKRVARGDRFRRTAPNTFAALASEVDKEED